MNYIKLLLSVGILSSVVSYSYAMTTVNAPIQNITLYPNAANVERIIPVQAGESVVTLTGLAANFDINQLQYKSRNIEVYAVSHTDSALDKPSGHESQKLRNEIEQVQREISAKSSIIQAAKLQNTF